MRIHLLLLVIWCYLTTCTASSSQQQPYSINQRHNLTWLNINQFGSTLSYPPPPTIANHTSHPFIMLNAIDRCEWTDIPTEHGHAQGDDVAAQMLSSSTIIVDPPTSEEQSHVSNDKNNNNDDSVESSPPSVPLGQATVGLPTFDQFMKQVRQYADGHKPMTPLPPHFFRDPPSPSPSPPSPSTIHVNENHTSNTTVNGLASSNTTLTMKNESSAEVATDSPSTTTNDTPIDNIATSTPVTITPTTATLESGNMTTVNLTSTSSATLSNANTTNTPTKTVNITDTPLPSTMSPPTLAPFPSTIIDIDISDLPVVEESSTGRPGAPPAEDDHSVNYASFDAGAKLLAHSNGMRSASSMLSNDNDRYMMSPCAYRQWFVVALSEDIIMSSVILSNKEHYSSGPRDFQVLGSIRHPTTEWMLLGQWRAADVNHKQVCVVAFVTFTFFDWLLFMVLILEYWGAGVPFTSTSSCTIPQVSIINSLW
jgi:hypothetical protein